MTETIERYCILFANLNTKITNGIKQPNKAIMLLCVMELVRCGYIKDNKIPIEDTIKIAFVDMWRKYFPNTPPSPWTPFWHLKNEPFWHFKPKYSKEDIDSLVSPGETASVGKMQTAISYAYLDNELFSLLKIKKNRDILTTSLLKTYIFKNK